MIRPTAVAVRTWSKVDFGRLGYSTDPDLQVLVDRTNALFESITGRLLDTTMPPHFDALAEQAVQRMTEILAFQSQEEYVETISDFQLIASFTAGSYSETRRSLTEIKDAKMLTADPGLNSLLMGLLTPDQMDFWLAWWMGLNLPAFEVTEVDWSHRFGISQYDPRWTEPLAPIRDVGSGTPDGIWST